jgi:ATP-grasp domain-containing protein
VTKHAVIVDPYGGGRDFGPAFRARGVSAVALLSTPAPLPAFAAGWHPGAFDEVVSYDGDFDGLTATVARYEPVCVVPANENAVELAERLCEVLTPGAGNVPGLTPARRDKWHMANAVARAGIPALRQIWSTDQAEVARWLDRSQLHGRRLVLKPPKSGGTDGTHVTEPGGDWRSCFEAINGAVNRFGHRNCGVLVQEFAEGTEYVVDMYSADGRHGLTEVCRYVKRESGNRLGLYDRCDFVPHDDPLVGELAGYARRVADAVGVRNGSTHIEIMMTAEGPRLIEIAARIAGTPIQQAARVATGDCQIDRTVRHVLDGEFTPGYRLRTHTWIVFVSAARAGVLRNAEVLEGIRDLPTTRLASLTHHNGERVPATEDLFTPLGWAVLACDDTSGLERDYRVLKDLERQVVITG